MENNPRGAPARSLTVLTKETPRNNLRNNNNKPSPAVVVVYALHESHEVPRQSTGPVPCPDELNVCHLRLGQRRVRPCDHLKLERRTLMRARERSMPTANRRK